MIGKTISRYKILEKIGEGGMGIVYKARDTKLDRFVALKFLPVKPDNEIISDQRFLQEAKAVAALNHPNIVTIHEIDDIDGQHYISMEYLEGFSLNQIMAERINDPESFNPEYFINIMLQVCDGLKHAHREGVVHRDIKPQNIMINEDGRIKILDFGLALLRGSSRLTERHFNVGTIQYMSPEQIKNEAVDHRTDIWSLGTVMYELATGRSPFNGDNDVAMIHSILKDKAEPLDLPDRVVSKHLSSIILKCLAKDVSNRYQNINELVRDLSTIKKTTKPMFSLVPDRLSSGRRVLLVVFTIVVLAFWIFFVVKKISEKNIDPPEVVPNKNIHHDAKRYTENIDAYALYLKGRDHWNRRTPEHLFKGIDFFKKAIEKDEDYAPAYVGLSDSYHLLASYSMLPPSEAFPKAKEAATKALVIDNTLGEALNSVAAVMLLYEWDWEMARRGFEKSLALNPNFATIHEWYAIYLTVTGNLDEGVWEMRKAVQLDPLSNSAQAGVARHLYFAGKFQESIRQYKKALELDPYSFYAMSMLGLTYAKTSNYSEALKCFNEARELTGGKEPGILAGMAYTLAASGKKSEALEMLVQLEEMSKHRYVPSFYFAIVHVGLGNTDKAFEWLEKAYVNRSEWMVYLKVEHVLSPLYKDPRFSSLVKRVGLDDVK